MQAWNGFLRKSPGPLMFNAVSEKSYDLTSVRALVVDDSELMRELIQEVLRSFGIGYVHSAPSAEDAMTEVHPKPPREPAGTGSPYSYHHVYRSL